MSKFLSSITDKAQHAINQTPLAGHIPNLGRPVSPGHEQPSANQAAAQGGSKNKTLESLQYQLRAFGQQYSSTTPVQKIITIEKGVAIDFDALSRDAKAQSKEFYTWGQGENEDIKDVTDRLAYLNFVHGSLASILASKLDAARAPLKALRDAETAITPKRNVRAGLHTQISRVEHDQAKGMEKKLAELRAQLSKHESDDEAQEKEIELLKRKAVKESEELKWQAFREYGEKVALLSQASIPMISALPSVPPSKSEPYRGTQATASARASLQRALENYKTGHVAFSSSMTSDADLSRSDTRSFGETHASELSSMPDTPGKHPGLPITPPPTGRSDPVQLHDPPVQHGHDAPPPSSFKSETSNVSTSSISGSSPSISASTLNNAPAPIPIQGTDRNTAVSPTPEPEGLTASVPSATPTVAETGMPVSASAKGGPGPASGSLRDIKAASPTAGPRSSGLPGDQPRAGAYGSFSAAGPAKAESAEEEKARLAREERERVLNQPAASTTPVHESAEDEKKRLEREERDRVLAQGGNAPGSNQEDGSRKGTEEDLPPYQDM